MTLTAIALWQMTGFSLQMGMGPFITTGLLQGFGLGFVFTPLSVVTFSTLPRNVLTQGTAIFSLMRNIGGSVGISIVEALFDQNTQVVHSRWSSMCGPTTRCPRAGAACPFSLTKPTASPRSTAESDAAGADGRLYRRFHADDDLVVAAAPLLLLLRRPRSMPRGAALAALD